MRPQTLTSGLQVRVGVPKLISSWSLHALGRFGDSEWELFSDIIRDEARGCLHADHWRKKALEIFKKKKGAIPTTWSYSTSTLSTLLFLPTSSWSTNIPDNGVIYVQYNRVFRTDLFLDHLAGSSWHFLLCVLLFPTCLYGNTLYLSATPCGGLKQSIFRSHQAEVRNQIY